MNAPVKTFTGVERAAVLMMLVGEEEAAAILQKLDPEEVRQLGAAMFSLVLGFLLQRLLLGDVNPRAYVAAVGVLLS